MITSDNSEHSDCNDNWNTLQIDTKAKEGDTTTQQNNYSIERRRVVAQPKISMMDEIN